MFQEFQRNWNSLKGTKCLESRVRFNTNWLTIRPLKLKEIRHHFQCVCKNAGFLSTSPCARNVCCDNQSKSDAWYDKIHGLKKMSLIVDSQFCARYFDKHLWLTVGGRACARGLCRIKIVPVVGRVHGLRETLQVCAATANVTLTLMKYRCLYNMTMTWSVKRSEQSYVLETVIHKNLKKFLPVQTNKHPSTFCFTRP